MTKQKIWVFSCALVLILGCAAMPLVSTVACAQTISSFEGIDASQIKGPQFDVDPNGAIGTKQYMQWVNVYYQAWDKNTHAPVWSAPQVGWQPWVASRLSQCYGFAGGDGLVMFDRLASRWIIAKRGILNGAYYYCVAVSNTDDLTAPTLRWFAYAIPLNSILGTNAHGSVYFPDWPKFGTWWNGYYVTFDLEDVNNQYQEIGVVACALDRNSMLRGVAARTPQCFSDPSPIPTNGGLFLGHSLIPADVDGVTPPPMNEFEYFISIENPPFNGVATTSNVINLWSMKISWATPSDSTFTSTSLSVPTYTPGCYDVAKPVVTMCVPESTTGVTKNYIDSVGDRMMPRLAYRNFGSYQSFLISHTVQVGAGSESQTGIRWYELRGNGAPSIYQSGTISHEDTTYRFMPSIAQDQAGNAVVGYSTSSATTHPGIAGSQWNLVNNTTPVEFTYLNGSGDQENTFHWGDYTSMTVDPVDNCTFWYTNQYLSANQTGNAINWDTRIFSFKLSSCP